MKIDEVIELISKYKEAIGLSLVELTLYDFTNWLINEYQFGEKGE